MIGIGAMIPVCRRCRGFTLIELAGGLLLAAVLTTGLATAVLLASRAIPDAASPVQQAMESAAIVEEAAEDLTYALSFTERTGRVVEFAVPDRNPSVAPGPEVIRYEWSGVAGDPLTKSVNGSAPTEIAADVREWSLGYVVETIIDDSGGSASTGEFLLASFDGWAGLIPSLLNQPISASDHVAECFTLSPPAGANKIIFTRARFMAYRSLVIVLGGAMQVSVRHSSQKGATPEPAATPLGSPVLMLLSDLSLVPQWTEVELAQSESLDVGDPNFCLVVGASSGASAYVQAYQNDAAGDNGMSFLLSSNAGGTWSAGASPHARDMRFYLYGAYSGASLSSVPQYVVRGVRIRLRCGSATTSAAETIATLANAPEVMTP